MQTRWTLRDREEMREATLHRYRLGEITAVQARGELGAQGWNATQIRDVLAETLKLIVQDTITKKGSGYAHND